MITHNQPLHAGQRLKARKRFPLPDCRIVRFALAEGGIRWIVEAVNGDESWEMTLEEIHQVFEFEN